MDGGEQAGRQALPRLVAGGEIGALIAARDWSASPLGPIERWPAALVGLLNMMLAAPAPMVLFWGERHVGLYNQAYAEMIGGRHPDSLGAPGAEKWGHAWSEMEPGLLRVRRDGKAETRRDQLIIAARGDAPREAYFDVTFSPVRDDDGAIAGVLAVLFEVTERVRATRVALDERERLARMFEQAPSFMALLREPGHAYEFANRAYHDMAGATELIGQPFGVTLGESQRRGFLAELDRVVATGHTYSVRAMPLLMDRGGDAPEQRVVDMIFQPVLDAAGTVTAIFVEGTDVTDRARAEERLALSESSLRLAIEVAEVGTWDVDLVANALHWSDRTKAMFGISPDAPVTLADFYAGLHPDDRETIAAIFAGALDPARRVTYDVEYRTIGKEDGRLRWVAARGRGIFDDSGRCVRAIGTALDITDRKLAQEALRESEQRFRSLADSAPALIWLCDEHGELIFANRWHEELFGRPTRDLLGGGWAAIIHPDDRDAFQADFDAAFAARLPFGRDVRVIDRHGATLWLHSEARPRHADGRFVGYVGCDVDITQVQLASEALERRIAERTGELAATNRQLSAQIEERERVEATLRQMQRLEAIGQLTSGVAHDFNNLLTVVLGNLEIVARTIEEAGLDRRTIDRLGYMRTAAERGATLTAQLLAFSRRQRLEARPVDLNESVAGMRDLLQSSMGGSVKLQTRLQRDLWPALVDPTQIELIILNLAINARDAMEVGGSLTVSTDNVVLGEPTAPGEPPPGEYVMIAVADNGTGMTPEVRAKAFEPFFTTKPIGKGSGLGLAQVYGFASQSGGGVGLETAPGEGTTVRVYLPRAAERRKAPREPGPPRPDERPPEASGRRVLVVDDDPPVREVTVSMLRAMGADVIEAGSGGAALELLDENRRRLDLAVLDFAMPGMNGVELTAALNARLPGLPILYVTGYADLTALAGVQAARIVQKPFRGDELQRKVAALLEQARA